MKAYSPTQSIMFVHFLVARFQEIILLIIHYKYSKSVRRIRCFKIWSSAQDYAVLALFLNIVETFISDWPKWSGGNDLYKLGTSSKKRSQLGWPLNIFTRFIGSGGCTEPCCEISGLHPHSRHMSEVKPVLRHRVSWFCMPPHSSHCCGRPHM